MHFPAKTICLRKGSETVVLEMEDSRQESVTATDLILKETAKRDSTGNSSTDEHLTSEEISRWDTDQGKLTFV